MPFEIAILALSGRMVRERDQIEAALSDQFLHNRQGLGESDLEAGVDAMVHQQLLGHRTQRADHLRRVLETADVPIGRGRIEGERRIGRRHA